MIKKFLNYINDYEVITNLEEYIDRTYPGAEVVEIKSLELPEFVQSEFGDGKNNCTLASILRVFMYHRDKFKILPESEESLYSTIKDAADIYFFNVFNGTLPMTISRIIKRSAEEYELNIKTKGHYNGNFYNPIKREIDNRRPLLMNIGFGKYKRHTVTISGYISLKYRGMNVYILEVYDNWSRYKRFIDYSYLAHSLKSLNAYTFNTIEIK